MSKRTKIQKAAIIVCSSLILGVIGAPHAEQVKPAVDGFNAKLELDAGGVDGDGAGFIAGSISVPLGHYFGLQLDGTLGEMDSRDADGLAAHLFFRDPDRYLLGLTTSSVSYRSQDIDRVGLEAELYRDQWTIGADLGEQSGDLGTDTYYNLNLKYYFHDNLALQGGIRGQDDDQTLTLGAEWQIKPAWAVMVKGGTGDGTDYLLAGVRFYLGKNKSLKRRHREDDPKKDTEETLASQEDALSSTADQSNGSGDGGGGGGGGGGVL